MLKKILEIKRNHTQSFSTFVFSTEAALRNLRDLPIIEGVSGKRFEGNWQEKVETLLVEVRKRADVQFEEARKKGPVSVGRFMIRATRNAADLVIEADLHSLSRPQVVDPNLYNTRPYFEDLLWFSKTHDATNLPEKALVLKLEVS